MTYPGWEEQIPLNKCNLLTAGTESYLVFLLCFWEKEWETQGGMIQPGSEII